MHGVRRAGRRAVAAAVRCTYSPLNFVYSLSIHSAGSRVQRTACMLVRWQAGLTPCIALSNRLIKSTMRPLLFILLALLLAGCGPTQPLMPNQDQTPDQSQTAQHAQHAAEQVRRQTKMPDYVGQQPLDFAPFADAVASLNDARAAEIDALLLPGGDPATVLDLQRYFDDGALSSTELTTYYLRRIQQHNPVLHAVLVLNPDALDIAQALDAERDAGNARGPLHGIPILLKANIGTGDAMPTSAGALALAAAFVERDAFIVEQLRAAGAVILGKANLSELANFVTSTSANGFSVLGGQTVNPYSPSLTGADQRFDVGGSSSGSGAAVAAGLATLAIGTETSGSIISPASQNAVVGLKPSLGLVSRDRIVPITAALDSAGPMARSVVDVAALLDAIAAPDARDPLTSDLLHGEARPAAAGFLARLDLDEPTAALDGLRIGVVRDVLTQIEGDGPVVEAGLQTLAEAGATLVDVDLAEFNVDYLPVLHHGMKHDLNTYLGETDAPVASVAELIAFNAEDPTNRAPFGQDLLKKSQAQALSEAEHDALVQQMRSEAGQRPARRPARARGRRAALRQQPADAPLRARWLPPRSACPLATAHRASRWLSPLSAIICTTGKCWRWGMRLSRRRTSGARQICRSTNNQQSTINSQQPTINNQRNYLESFLVPRSAWNALKTLCVSCPYLL